MITKSEKNKLLTQALIKILNTKLLERQRPLRFALYYPRRINATPFVARYPKGDTRLESSVWMYTVYFPTSKTGLSLLLFDFTQSWEREIKYTISRNSRLNTSRKNYKLGHADGQSGLSSLSLILSFSLSPRYVRSVSLPNKTQEVQQTRSSRERYTLIKKG